MEVATQCTPEQPAQVQWKELGREVKCFIPVRTFSASKLKEKYLWVMLPSSQGTLQRPCKQDHYEKDVQHGEIWSNVYDMLSWCAIVKWATERNYKGSQSVQLDGLFYRWFQKRQPLTDKHSSRDAHAMLCTDLHICLIPTKISKCLYTYTN